MVALDGRQLAPEPPHLVDDAGHLPCGHPGDDVVGAAGLEDQHREHRRELGGRQVVPQPQTQRLGGDQVALAVDPHQVAALLGDPGLPRLVGEVAQRGEHVADPVEGARDGVGPGLDAAAQRRGVAVELEPALAPAGVVLAVRAAVARVRLQLGAQPGDLLVVRGVRALPVRLVRPVGATARRWVHEPVGLAAQGRGEVAAGLRVAAVEVARHPEPRHRRDRRREVDEGQPACLALGRQHVGTRLVTGGARVDHHGVPGELAARHLDDVAGPQRRRGRPAPRRARRPDGP